MSENSIFPITSNRSVLPKEFRCEPQDMSLSEFQPLVYSGCTCFCPVESPPGWEVVRKGNSEPRHIDLFFISSGSIVHSTEEKTIRAGAGEMLSVLSWVDRRLYQDESSTHVYFRFDNPECYPLVCENGVRPCSAIDEIDFYTRALCRGNRNLPDGNLYRTHLVGMLHILVQRELHCVLSSGAFLRGERLQKILSNASRSDYSADHIAREFGMSFSNFRKFCMDNFAKSPRAVIEEARMLRARSLLDYSIFSIEQIAERLGYADRFTFSKAFQRIFQITPVAFRKRYNRLRRQNN